MSAFGTAIPPQLHAFMAERARPRATLVAQGETVRGWPRKIDANFIAGCELPRLELRAENYKSP
jgi:hypothetical protein